MTTGHLRDRYARLTFVVGLLALLVAGSAAYAAPTQAASSKAQRGFVMSGDRPVRSALVTLYATGGGSGPRVLCQARTRRDGSFRMASPQHARRDETRYIIAERGRLPSSARPNRAIDPSGNAWLTNNWRQIPNTPNPGGHQMVVFIGLAEPVRTPLIGPVRTP